MSKLWASVQRWWHCLWGMFDGHRMQDVYAQLDDPGYFRKNEITWVGCECGKAFWWKTDYPPLTIEEIKALERSGFDLNKRL